MSSVVVYQTSATQRAHLGQEHIDGPGAGRVYRYTKNGVEALGAGLLVQGPVNEASHSNLAVTAAKAATAKSITVTVKQAKVDTDDYKDGYLYVNDAAGQGYVYDIVGNTWAAAGEAGNPCVVSIEGELIVALTTSSEATLVKNPYVGVTLPFLKAFAPVMGVTPIPVPVNHYFWLQVRGPAAVLQEGTLYVGRQVMLSNKVRGAATLAKQVIPIPTKSAGEALGNTLTEAYDYTQDALKRRITATTVVTAPQELLTKVSGLATLPEQILGYCLDPRADTEYALIDLKIA